MYLLRFMGVHGGTGEFFFDKLETALQYQKEWQEKIEGKKRFQATCMKVVADNGVVGMIDVTEFFICLVFEQLDLLRWGHANGEKYKAVQDELDIDRRPGFH